ncbi:MAG TPA: PorP/SprF family type IX secretion system membrane protein [Chitinophagales bacterium]|nr:PorP/SprF family type IX secretion system membrane protein [Chitinophagales bacterium]
MKKYLQKVFFVTSIVLCFTGVKSQDIHFSQYNSSPLALNPALAGLNNCDYRVYANFRTQWMTVSSGNTYRTFAGGADMSVGKITKYNSFAGLGVSFIADQAGDVNFNTNRVELSFAYHFMLNRKGTMQISAGLQGAFNHRSINQSKATFDSQYDPSTGTVDPNGVRENFGRNRVMFGDAGLGLIFSAMTRSESNYYFGFGLNHVNQPRISFYPSGQDRETTGNERLNMKVTLHGGASIPVGKRLSIMPNFLVLVQKTTYEFNVGCNFKTTLGNDAKRSTTAFHLGAQYRGLLDAFIVHAKFDIKGFSAGLSYDINVSKLLPASRSVGAPEISLMYQGCYRKKPKPGHCPVMF